MTLRPTFWIQVGIVAAVAQWLWVSVAPGTLSTVTGTRAAGRASVKLTVGQSRFQVASALAGDSAEPRADPDSIWVSRCWQWHWGPVRRWTWIELRLPGQCLSRFHSHLCSGKLYRRLSCCQWAVCHAAAQAGWLVPFTWTGKHSNGIGLSDHHRRDHDDLAGAWHLS